MKFPVTNPGLLGGLAFPASPGNAGATPNPLGQAFMGPVRVLGQAPPAPAPAAASPAPSPQNASCSDESAVRATRQDLEDAVEETEVVLDHFERLSFFIGPDNAKKALDLAVSKLEAHQTAYNTAIKNCPAS